jgi:hypothetical protein
MEISLSAANVLSRKYQLYQTGESFLPGRVDRLRKNNRGLSPQDPLLTVVTMIHIKSLKADGDVMLKL